MDIQPASQKQRPQRDDRIFPALTGLRWVAAFCVWCHHFPPRVPMPGLLASFLKELHIGVPIFFVLSGFLITLRYSQEARVDRHWLRNYARNRVARIYPVYFLVTAITLVAIPLAGGLAVDWKVAILNFTLLRGFFDEFKFTGVPQGWSLTVEECFYFSAPLIFVLWRRWKVGLGWVLGGLYAVGLLLWLIGRSVAYHGLFYPLDFVVAFTYFGHAFTFVAGMWLARRMLSGAELRLPGRIPMTYCGVAAVVLATFVLTCGQSDEFAHGVQNPAYRAFSHLVFPPLICLLIAGLVTETTWVSKFLGSAPLVLLGKASYCFYLIHLGFLQGYFHGILPKAWKAHRYWWEFGMLVASAVVLYLIVEKPLNQWIRAKRA